MHVDREQHLTENELDLESEMALVVNIAVLAQALLD